LWYTVSFSPPNAFSRSLSPVNPFICSRSLVNPFSYLWYKVSLSPVYPFICSLSLVNPFSCLRYTYDDTGSLIYISFHINPESHYIRTSNRITILSEYFSLIPVFLWQRFKRSITHFFSNHLKLFPYYFRRN
jgi:hypothetical protein